MLSKVELVRGGVLSGVFVLASLLWWQTPGSCACLQAHFLDVGQGDATLIQTPSGREILIDGGPDGAVLRELAGVQGWFDRDIDMVVATHPDTDHVGGLVDVLEYYDVDLILQTTNIGESPAAAAYAAAAAHEEAEVIEAEAGQVIDLGDGVVLEVLAPVGDETEWESNAASIIMRVTYGDTAVLLTGDAPASIEDYLAGAYGAGLRSDLLKLGHHGSKTSTSDFFLDTVQPKYAVVSAGIDNRYGHPHHSVIERVFTRDIETFHTGLDGTVSFESDGTKVRVK